jgi:hypothetical protein
MARPVIFLWLLIWLAALGAASAQQGTTEIRGRIADEQGAALPASRLSSRNQDSGIVRETMSSADGSYFISALSPGTYEIAAELQGFKRYHRPDIQLEVDRTTTIDIGLERGGVQDVVIVRAATTAGRHNLQPDWRLRPKPGDDGCAVVQPELRDLSELAARCGGEDPHR